MNLSSGHVLCTDSMFLYESDWHRAGNVGGRFHPDQNHGYNQPEVVLELQISPRRAQIDVAVRRLPVLLGSAVGRGDLIAKTVVLVRQALGLLLQSLNIAVPGGKLSLETANLAHFTSVIEASSTLALVNLGVTLHAPVLLLETEDVKDHAVGAVEDERKEKGEATEVHVALRVKLAGLDLHTLWSANGRDTVQVSMWVVCTSQKKQEVSLPSIGGALGSRRKLKLNAVNAVDTVDEQYQDEDKRNLARVSKDAAGGVDGENRKIPLSNTVILL